MNRNLELEPHKNLKQPYFMNNGPNLPFPSSLIFNYFLKNQTSVAEFENIQTTHRALKIRTEPPEIPGIESEINFSKKIAIENNENIERGFTLKGIKKKLNSFLLNKNKGQLLFLSYCYFNIFFVFN